MVEIIYGVSVTNHPFSSSYRQEEKPDKAVSKKENSRFIRERSVTMKPKNERPFYKVIAVLLAVTMMSAGLTGCDWFKPRQEESQQTIELEAPEPDEEDPGEDILDENEVSAEVDPTIEEKEEGQVKE